MICGYVWSVQTERVGIRGTYPSFKRFELCGSQRICLSNDGNDINARGKPLHEFNIHFPKPGKAMGQHVDTSEEEPYACPVGGMK
jgi:hypothetical protein